MVEADDGKNIKVRASFTDHAGNQESQTSAPTATVAVRATPLTGLTVNPGTLAPAFHSYTFNYAVPGRLQLRQPDNRQRHRKGRLRLRNRPRGRWKRPPELSTPGACPGWHITDGSGNTFEPLTDADADSPGFQIDLDEDENHFAIRVYQGVGDFGEFYWLTIIRAPGPLDAPQRLNVSPHDSGVLDLYWEAPPSNGGSEITGYRVQWKEAAGSWDTAADVSEATVTGTTHTITGLIDGVEYAVRVIGVNDEGDGPPSDEATGTPRETTPPELSTATVDGATLTLTYDEDLDENSEPSPDAFSVTVGGTGRAVDGVSVSGSSVILTLGSAVAVEETVTVSYAAPTDAAAPRIQDDAGNPAASFSDQDVENNTPPPANTPATGAPTITGTDQVGETLTADISGIGDDDGLPAESEFDYQWIAGTTDISGATGSSYAPLVADLGKTIKVRVSFEDDQNNFESLTSAATGAVTASPYGAVIWSGTMTVGMLQIFGVSLFGFDAPNAGTSLDIGDLEPSAFSYAGNSYIIETIAHFSDSGELEFGLDVPLVSGDFNLNLDGTPFLVRSDGNTSLYAFSNHGLSWTNGQEVAVRLAVNRPATGAPTITGTAQVGETLTADISGIGDDDGLPAESEFDYQWIRNDGSTDANIAGATDSTYVLLAADVGKFIKVQVTFTDKNDYTETLTSAVTTEVAAATPAPGPIIGFTVVDASDQSVEGALADGGTLALDDPDGGSFGIRADLESGATIGSMSL